MGEGIGVVVVGRRRREVTATLLRERVSAQLLLKRKEAEALRRRRGQRRGTEAGAPT